MGKSTYNSLLARGFDSAFANTLIEKGYKLKDLKSLQISDLINLGLSEELAKKLDSESRPPIPADTVIKILNESKFCCCVCRDSKKSIIIHHIEEWSISKSHEENNLVVLCLEHHDLAHTKKELSINLTASKLEKLKSKWIEDAKIEDTYAILGLIKPDGARWDYFNVKRIFEIIINIEIPFQKFKSYSRIKNKYVDESGLFFNSDKWFENSQEKPHMYNFGDGMFITQYLKELFESLLKTLPIIDLTPKFNKPILKNILKIGDFVAIQAGFYIKNLTKNTEGHNQTRRIYYTKNNVSIQFTIDAYECTSVSAWGDHLMGHKTLTPVGIITSIVEEEKNLIITISCLAIGAWFDEHAYRKHLKESIEKFSYGYFSEDDDDD